MLDDKKCRKIKTECTKKYDGQNIIVNVEQYPFTYVIITHGDGKSWGYFYELTEEFFSPTFQKSYYSVRNAISYVRLGRSNSKMIYPHLSYGDNEITSNYNVIIVANDPEVKRAYSEIFSKLYRVTKWYYTENYFDYFFAYNPKLVAILFDQQRLLFKKANDGATVISFEYCYSCMYLGDVFKPSAKDAFKFSLQWLEVMRNSGIDREAIKPFIDRGYRPSDFKNCSTSLP